MGAQWSARSLEDQRQGRRRNHDRHRCSQAIYAEGLRLVEAGINPMDIKRGIDAAVEVMLEAVKNVREAHQGQGADRPRSRP